MSFTTPTPQPTPSPSASKKPKVKKQDAQVNVEMHDTIVKGLGATGTGTTGTDTRFSITPKENAYSELDRTMIDLFGRRASASEKSAYYQALHTAEKHYATTSTSTDTSSTTTNYLFDKDSFLFEFTANLADTYIKAGKELGGKAGQTYQNLKTYAGAMGVSDDDKTTLKNTIKVIKGSADETSLKASMRKRAISLYGGLSEALNNDPTLTVKEAASDYINIMSNMLDINAQGISLHDPTLTKAINATKDGKPYAMNLNEFTSLLRNDARFQYSTTAHNEARDLASSFAQAFGFGG